MTVAGINVSSLAYTDIGGFLHEDTYQPINSPCLSTGNEPTIAGGFFPYKSITRETLSPALKPFPQIKMYGPEYPCGEQKSMAGPFTTVTVGVGLVVTVTPGDGDDAGVTVN